MPRAPIGPSRVRVSGASASAGDPVGVPRAVAAPSVTDPLLWRQACVAPGNGCPT